MVPTEALGRAGDLLARAAAATRGEGWRIPNGELLEGLRHVQALRGLIESMHLDLLREVDTRGVAGAAGSAPVATTTEGLVREVTGASPGHARADVAAARVTGPDGPLAGFGERLAAGRVTRGHVDVAVRCLDRIPRHLTRDDGGEFMGPVVSEFLLRVVDSHADERTLARHAKQLLAHLAPDPTDRRDPDAPERAFLDYRTDDTGMLVGRFQLDLVAGAALKAAIDRYSAPLPADPVTAGAVTARDDRSPRRRRADALARVADITLGVTTPRRGERPRIVVHATADQLAGVGGGLATTDAGEPIASWVLSRLACDAVVQRVVVGDSAGPLDVGRSERLVTLAQRWALAARDRGCVICGAQPDWCDAHHVTPWSAGGATDLDNLVLLCPGHHTAVHAGGWAVEREAAGHLVLVPPRWVDPRRRPRRPSAHVLADAMRDIERHLAQHAFTAADAARGP